MTITKQCVKCYQKFSAPVDSIDFVCDDCKPKGPTSNRWLFIGHNTEQQSLTALKQFMIKEA